MLVFEERGKAEYPEKNFRVENQQETQPTHDAGSGNRTLATVTSLLHANYKENLMTRRLQTIKLTLKACLN